MPRAFLAQLFQRLLPFLEVIFLHFTQLPQHSRVLAFAPDLTRPKGELVLENALLLLASRLPNWKQALSILTPDTLLHWHRQGFKLFWPFKTRTRLGRPRLFKDLIALIQQMAPENHTWGAERIRGELLKLGIRVAKDTIQTYLRRTRPPRSPSQDWNTFLKNHAKDVWACDFLPVIDLFFRQVLGFFIIELVSRRVVHFGVARQRTDAWVAQHLREATPYGRAPRFLIRDHDGQFGRDFAQGAKSSRIEVRRIPFRAPRANAVCERFLKSVRNECLDYMLIWSEPQLHRVVKEYIEFFNAARPHQGIGQRIPERTSRSDEEKSGRKIIAFPVLNGLHHDYRRAA